MKPDTAHLLRSPISHNPLQLVVDVQGGAYLEDALSGTRFPIRDGIPCLLDDSRVIGYNKKYQRFYNLVAPLYDVALALGARLARSSVDELRMQYIEELELKEGDSFLEVSIGTGANIKYLPVSVLCYGLDISWGMLKRCRKNLARWRREAELFLGDAEELPFLDAQFDSVLHVGGINAFNDRKKAIAEMVRVAVSGSKIVIVDETAQLIDKLSWFPGARRMLRTSGDRFRAPVDLVPEEMHQVQAKEIMGGDLYCLSFYKP